jgi:hypothetical protein
MISTAAEVSAGIVTAYAVSGRGFTPEELADHALNKIIHIGQGADPVIRAQAEAYSEQIRTVLVAAMYQAVKSNQTTLANRFIAAGHPELIKLLGN